MRGQQCGQRLRDLLAPAAGSSSFRGGREGGMKEWVAAAAQRGGPCSR